MLITYSLKYHLTNLNSTIAVLAYTIFPELPSSLGKKLRERELITNSDSDNVFPSKKEKDTSKNELSGEEQKRLKIEIEKILSNKKLSDDLKKVALEVLSSKYKNECFLNIVEEIEQNLFPTSQKNVLYKLLEFANMTKGNQLILTTHSPYIINYLTLAIKGHQVLRGISSSPNIDLLKQKLEQIVPEVSCISEEDSIIYELTEKGDIRKLSTYDGLPSDENYLNISLAETNKLFGDLLEIEEQL